MKSVLFSLVLIFFSLNVSSQPVPGIFGYYANSEISQNEDHINTAIIWARWDNLLTSRNHILSQLNLANQNSLKAIIALDPFLFDTSSVSGSGVMECNYFFDINAANNFSNLVSDLISFGYLIPNNPAASTVIAFHPIDEPELCGLNDFGSNPNPNLQAAVNVVKNNSNTSNFPVWVSVHGNYSSVKNGMKLFDWVSMHDYDATTSQYISNFLSMTNQLNSNQRVFLLPQASSGGSLMAPFGPPHDPVEIMNWFNSDSRVIGVIPFLWSHPQTSGVRDIPNLKAAYTNYGKQIKNNQVIEVDVDCDLEDFSWDSFECTAQVTGGTQPYSYDWSTGDQTSVTYETLQCPHPQSGQYYSEEMTVIVTDANGLYHTGSDFMVCP